MSQSERKTSGVNALDVYCFKNNIPDFTFSNTECTVSTNDHVVVPLKLQMILPEVSDTNIHLARNSLANAILSYLENGTFSHLQDKTFSSCNDLLQEYTILTTNNEQEAITWCHSLTDKIVGLEFDIAEDFLIKTIMLAGNNTCLIYHLQNNVIPAAIKAIIQSDTIKKISQNIDIKYIVFGCYDVQCISLLEISDTTHHTYGFRLGTPINVLAKWSLNVSLAVTKLQYPISSVHAILYLRVYTKTTQDFAAHKKNIRLKWTFN